MPDKKIVSYNGLHMTLECKDTKLYFGWFLGALQYLYPEGAEQIIKKNTPQNGKEDSLQKLKPGRVLPHIVRLNKKGIFFHWEYFVVFV